MIPLAAGAAAGAAAVALLVVADGPGAPPSPAPAPAYETVVTATRVPRAPAQVATSVTTLDRETVDGHPSLTGDALLRAVPSAALFRRTPAPQADPTSQGLNLRGVGPSGVSRALVLVDGVPANEGFGGWVYWEALPRLALDRVEVAPGGASALYGSSALGGVVQFISRPVAAAERDELALDALGGAQRTWRAAAYASHARGPAAGAVEAEAFGTGGYVPVSPAARGPVDVEAWNRYGRGRARLELAPSRALRVRLSLSGFSEVQSGGTAFTAADVQLGQAAASLSWRARAGTFEAGTFGTLERFHQLRARVAADRASEALAAEQRVPSGDVGAWAAFFARELRAGGVHVPAAGVEARRVAGTAHEDLFPAQPSPSAAAGRRSGGTQLVAALWLQELWAPAPWLDLTAGVRADAWRNDDGVLVTRAGDGSEARAAFAPRAETQIDPRAGAVVRPAPWLALRAAGYRAFRAPTLNELYRPFQVGNVLTAANADLRAERLWGAESGFDVIGPAGLRASATAFANRLDDAIANVTLGSPLPDGSGRQRQNLGRARIRGVELGVEVRPAPHLVGRARYTYVEPVVVSAPQVPALAGKDLPQDPRHRAAVAVGFADPRIVTAWVDLYVTGGQFEDDLNALPMGPAVLLGASLARRIAGGWELFAAGQNLLDRRYLVSRAGVDLIGPPLTVWTGVRLRSGG